ncbi:hypothetical protein AV530_007403 [Patagioenas fasciata monilis]|uniref:Uncharacterized protein n=1 Tax=Patagioenas fasciata monilis TaxID=372326 RepID=A0A1V4JXP7_PATFA|nr:hypothetical protein AV530_007403 [Patagioenas fasciata monilis]
MVLWARWASGTSFLPYCRRNTHLKISSREINGKTDIKPHRTRVVARTVIPNEMSQRSEDPEFMENYHDWKVKPVKRIEDWDEDICYAIISLLLRKQRKQTATGLFERRKIELENYSLPDVPELLPERQTADADGHDNQENRVSCGLTSDKQVDQRYPVRNNMTGSTKGMFANKLCSSHYRKDLARCDM